MRDPARINLLLAKLAAVWKQHPDMRFGQLVSNLYSSLEEHQIWNIEDDKTSAVLESWLDASD
jgi:hypothetical protein